MVCSLLEKWSAWYTECVYFSFDFHSVLKCINFDSCLMLFFTQGCCVNAPMIVIADYTKGAEGYTYNYYVSYYLL